MEKERLTANEMHKIMEADLFRENRLQLLRVDQLSEFSRKAAQCLKDATVWEKKASELRERAAIQLAQLEKEASKYDANASGMRAKAAELEDLATYMRERKRQEVDESS